MDDGETSGGMRLNAVIDALPSSYGAIGSGLSQQRFRQNDTFKGTWRGLIAALHREVYNHSVLGWILLLGLAPPHSAEARRPRPPPRSP